MGDIYLVHKDELMHYGVKGMKWGVRRRSEAVQTARSNYKTAKKEYNKAYNSAYKYSRNHSVGQFTNKKKSAEADKRWGDAYDKAEKASKAKDAYKQAKKDYDKTPEGQEVAARRKKAIKTGAVVAGTVLAAYGAKKFIDTKSQKIVLDKGEAAAKKLINNESIRSMKVKGDTVHFVKGNGETFTSRFSGQDANKGALLESKLRNKVILADASKIRDDARKAASNMNFKEKSKTVYDYYRKRKK